MLIFVDKNGDRIVNREPGPDDFQARTAARYNYGGTIPIYDAEGEGSMPNPTASRAKIQERVDYEIRALRNKELLEKAVFLLSQTDDGSRLLNMAWDAKFTFVFDHHRMNQEDAVGLCDYDNKRISLAEGRTAEEVSVTLKHELQHFEDNRNGVSYNAGHTLLSAITASRGLEANARVSEAIYAMESMLGRPDGPPNQFRSAAPMECIRRKNPEIAMAALQNKRLAKEGRWQEFANAIFYAYYKQEVTLAYYDRRIVNLYSKGLPEEKKQAMWDDTDVQAQQLRQLDARLKHMLQQNVWTAASLAEKLLLMGKPFLRCAGENSPDSNFCRGITIAGRKALEGLKEKIEKLSQGKVALPSGLVIVDKEDESRWKKIGANVVGKLRSSFTRSAVYVPPATEPFAAIVFPSHTDGVRMTSGERKNAFISDVFMKDLREERSGNTELDRIHFTIMKHMERSSLNNFGSVNELLEAGFRAPMAAFPDKYLKDLFHRIQLSAAKGMSGVTESSSKPLSNAEVKLLEHWQILVDNGLSPQWGSELGLGAGKGQDHMIRNFPDVQRWMDFLQSTMKLPSVPEGKGSQPAARVSA